jgi:hypothetical protein
MHTNAQMYNLLPFTEVFYLLFILWNNPPLYTVGPTRNGASSFLNLIKHEILKDPADPVAR